MRNNSNNSTNTFEGFVGAIRTVFVRVQLERKLPVCLFYVVVAGIFADGEDLIVALGRPDSGDELTLLGCSLMHRMWRVGS